MPVITTDTDVALVRIGTLHHPFSTKNTFVSVGDYMAVTRTKASEVFGTYGTRPLDLHGDWYLVSCHARLLGMELIAHCKDPADLRLPVGADWRETLCAKLIISGPDRRNAKVALNKLVDAGFLHHEDSHVRISLVPEQKLKTDSLRIQSGSTSVSLRSQSGSTPDPKQTEPVEIIHGANLSREVNKGGSEGPPARPVEILNFRRPLPEPPPNLPPAEPPLPEQIVSAHAVRYVKLRNGETCKRDYRAANAIAKWCEENATVHGTNPPDLALRVVAGLFASDRAGERRWPLSWAANDPAEFLAPPPGVKPVIARAVQPAAAPTPQAHQLMKF